MSKLVERFIEMMRPKWHTIPETPQHMHDGLYVVAQFDKDTFEGWSYYACLDGYWGPNTLGCGLTHPTHYMTIKEFHTLLETLPRE